MRLLNFFLLLVLLTIVLFYNFGLTDIKDPPLAWMPCWPRDRPNTRSVPMSIDRAVLAFAGFVVLLSLALGYYVSPYWFLLTAFAGVNMIQAAFTGFCPAAMIFKKLGLRAGVAFD